ncbi:peptidoglycan-binding protein [Streptomyces sp. DG2A-72]|uniref:peptidoglycan-binding protein n=1 Tax=Streptomyces sp. DG2A-72 TaxID=3051386 RepID=UPI00265C88EC|nr:peptidoglycan-binding protein [Streptomyces sp. DG2A-72]MDO0930781.1 peptidoglycan-binding protein [Streptomyces sp. DG2A-72]
MSRWKELPAELNPRVRQLVVRLRRLKDHSGLSMRQLETKTGYSAKSWERYLGGRSLPPPEAVEAMARICGDDPTRLLALREVAIEAWRPPATPRTAPTTKRRPPQGVLVAGALVLAVFATVLLAVQLDGGAAASPSRSKPTYTCRLERNDGRWYAGNSRTADAVLTSGQAGPKVAEAQCLLRRAGISPGDVDGIYGPLTEAAVKRLQQRAGLVVDGIVGPHTWGALRA